jgi:hypothetical protein
MAEVAGSPPSRGADQRVYKCFMCGKTRSSEGRKLSKLQCVKIEPPREALLSHWRWDFVTNCPLG